MNDLKLPLNIDGLDELIKLLSQATKQAKQLQATISKIQTLKLIVKS